MLFPLEKIGISAHITLETFITRTEKRGKYSLSSLSSQSSLHGEKMILSSRTSWEGGRGGLPTFPSLLSIFLVRDDA